MTGTAVQAAVQAAAETAQEAGSTFGYLLVLGPDGVTPMHVSPDALAAAFNNQPILTVNPAPVTS